jgi:hypothetical protein
MLCSNCGINSMCSECLDFSFKGDFECPPCFLKRDKNAIYVCHCSKYFSRLNVKLQA